MEIIPSLQLQIVEHETLRPMEEVTRPAVICVAAWFGHVRLMDNVEINIWSRHRQVDNNCQILIFKLISGNCLLDAQNKWSFYMGQLYPTFRNKLYCFVYWWFSWACNNYVFRLPSFLFYFVRSWFDRDLGVKLLLLLLLLLQVWAVFQLWCLLFLV